LAKRKRYVFHSPRLGLVINAQPDGPRVEFVNGEFTTDDPKVAAFLRGHSGYGLWIFEASEEPVAAEKPVARKGKKSEAVDFAEELSKQEDGGAE